MKSATGRKQRASRQRGRRWVGSTDRDVDQLADEIGNSTMCGVRQQRRRVRVNGLQEMML